MTNEIKINIWKTKSGKSYALQINDSKELLYCHAGVFESFVKQSFHPFQLANGNGTVPNGTDAKDLSIDRQNREEYAMQNIKALPDDVLDNITYLIDMAVKGSSR